MTYFNFWDEDLPIDTYKNPCNEKCESCPVIRFAECMKWIELIYGEE